MKKHTFVLSIALIILVSIFIVGCGNNNDPIEPGDTAIVDRSWTTINQDPNQEYTEAVHVYRGTELKVIGHVDEYWLLVSISNANVGYDHEVFVKVLKSRFTEMTENYVTQEEKEAEHKKKINELLEGQ